MIEVAGEGTVLRVQTSLGGALTCQGFRLSDGKSSITFTTTTLSNVTTWKTWKDNVERIGSADYFLANGSTLTYKFRITTDSAPVTFAGEVAARNLTGTHTCW